MSENEKEYPVGLLSLLSERDILFKYASICLQQYCYYNHNGLNISQTSLHNSITAKVILSYSHQILSHYKIKYMLSNAPCMPSSHCFQTRFEMFLKAVSKIQ